MSDTHLEILAHEMTPLGVLCLRRRELLCEPGKIVTEVTLEHEFLMSSLYTDSERALVQTAMQMHAGADLRVLVGGLGLGYTAREALLSERVARVEVVELLPQVIDWLREKRLGAAFVRATGRAASGDHTGRCIPTARRPHR